MSDNNKNTPKPIKQNGKGSKKRPMQISYCNYSDNWEKIFGKNKKDNDK